MGPSRNPTSTPTRGASGFAAGIFHSFVSTTSNPGSASPAGGDFWAELTRFAEGGMAFLVEHPRLARLTATAADPSADRQVRGLHAAVYAAGERELAALLARGVAQGAIAKDTDLHSAAVLATKSRGMIEGFPRSRCRADRQVL